MQRACSEHQATSGWSRSKGFLPSAAGPLSLALALVGDARETPSPSPLGGLSLRNPVPGRERAFAVAQPLPTTARPPVRSRQLPLQCGTAERSVKRSPRRACPAAEGARRQAVECSTQRGHRDNTPGI